MTTAQRPEWADNEALQNYLEYLDRLRETGATNMFGAAPWLADEFFLSRQECREVLVYWMNTYSERHAERARP